MKYKKIAILGDMGISNNPGGIGYFTRELVNALIEFTDYRIIIFHAKNEIPEYSWINDIERIEIIESTFKSRTLYRIIFPIFKINISYFVGRVDAFLDPMNLCYVKCSSKSYYYIHDLFPETYPKKFPLVARLYRKHFFSLIKRNKNNIITISNFSKKTIIDYGIKKNKIKVIYPGEINNEDNGKVHEKISGIPSHKYFLFIGRNDFRKNLTVLIKAFRDYAKKNAETKLVIAGSSGKGSDDVYKLIRKYNLTNRVILLGYINQAEKKYLYQNALCYVYPSLVEGFGFPILEAFSNDCLLVCSNSSCIPEIASDAAIYFDSSNNKELTKILSNISEGNVSTKVYLENGRKRLNNFSWKKYINSLNNLLFNE